MFFFLIDLAKNQLFPKDKLQKTPRLVLHEFPERTAAFLDFMVAFSKLENGFKLCSYIFFQYPNNFS